MSDVEVYEPRASVVDLVEKAREMDAAYQIAQKLAPTAFVPASYRGKVAETAAAIVAGAELGLPLMAALRSIDIIDGTPALRAITLRALVIKAGHEIWVEESTSQRAIVKGRRVGSDHVAESTWTMDRAKKAELAGKKNWARYPEAMLIARATADVVRLIAPEVILGLPYTAEEVGDGAFDEPVAGPDASKPAPRRTARRAALPPKQVEPVASVQPKADVVDVEPIAEASAPDPVDASAGRDEREVAAKAREAFEDEAPPFDDVEPDWGGEARP
ncbi:recombinase RecT [Agromyces larvae]|uniref:Recombinase RecT n=1 Tax=Agromyces larvae TaxID=2929802 RepID=A0ABY4C690_9MICO|nr:recombinase RecT [Agromyces larvae]UOE45508.1 recombinase RecT [Agromyces larvae]